MERNLKNKNWHCYGLIKPTIMNFSARADAKMLIERGFKTLFTDSIFLSSNGELDGNQLPAS